MTLKTFLVTVELRVVVNVPDDFTEEDCNNSLDFVKNKLIVGSHKIDDLQVMDTSVEEHDD